MNSMTRWLVCAWVCLAAVVSIGCAGRPSGEAFRPEEVSGDKAVIYVFRESQMGARNVRLYLDQKLVGDLRAGRYRAFVVSPGQHLVRASARAESTCEVAVGPGESAYVQVSTSRFQKRRPEIQIPETETGRQLIAKTVRSPE